LQGKNSLPPSVHTRACAVLDLDRLVPVGIDTVDSPPRVYLTTRRCCARRKKNSIRSLRRLAWATRSPLPKLRQLQGFCQSYLVAFSRRPIQFKFGVRDRFVLKCLTVCRHAATSFSSVAAADWVVRPYDRTIRNTPDPAAGLGL
jgi:hypothetical protein